MLAALKLLLGAKITRQQFCLFSFEHNTQVEQRVSGGGEQFINTIQQLYFANAIKTTLALGHTTHCDIMHICKYCCDYFLAVHLPSQSCLTPIAHIFVALELLNTSYQPFNSID